jgi:hypothetical protein
MRPGTRGIIRLDVLAAMAVCVCLAVSACGQSGGTKGSSAAAGAATPTSTSGSTAAGATPTQQPQATPSSGEAGTPTVTSHKIEQSGTFGQIDFDEPVVGGVPAAVAMNAAIESMVNGYINEYKSAAEGSDLYLTGRFSVELASPTLLSLRFDIVMSTGGVHPNEYVDALTFRVPSGQKVAFESLFADPEAAMTQLNEAVHDSLTAQLGDDMLWDYADDYDSLADAFALSGNGLELGWSEGDAADVAHGPVWIVLSWPDIEGIIDPAGPAAEFEPQGG